MRDFNSRRVLFDTNIIIDAVDKTRPEHYEAQNALRHCNGGGDMGLVTAGSLKDAYYSLRRMHNEAAARAAVLHMLNLLVVLPLDGEATLIAAESNEPDFEDALVRAAAELNDVAFILTRDKKAFRNSRIRSMTCAEYLDIVKAEDENLRKLR